MILDPGQVQRASAAAVTMAAGGTIDINNLFIEQLYSNYTPEDHAVWGDLFRSQQEHLNQNASQLWLNGARAIGLVPEFVPELTCLNARLNRLTGWRSRAVPGYVSARPFFACLSHRIFPTTIVVRPRGSMGYLPEPDIFHDVFGHVPLHADQEFAEFLEQWGKCALLADDADLERLTRLFWFTVEFGLVRESGRIKVYGAGLISSPEESRSCLESQAVDRRPFHWREVCNTPFEIDKPQPILYVLESFAQLLHAMKECELEVSARSRKRQIVTHA